MEPQINANERGFITTPSEIILISRLQAKLLNKKYKLLCAQNHDAYLCLSAFICGYFVSCNKKYQKSAHPKKRLIHIIALISTKIGKKYHFSIIGFCSFPQMWRQDKGPGWNGYSFHKSYFSTVAQALTTQSSRRIQLDISKLLFSRK